MMVKPDNLATMNSEIIEQLGIVQNAKDDQYRAIGYDLSVGHIVKPDGELATRYKLPAQGIVEVISRERLHMPPNVYANVLIKTRLSNEGLLALGIGVVDPGYHGRISSFIVNFSKDPQIIELGQSFLRCIFYRIDESSRYSVVDIPDNKYISDSRRRVVSDFGDPFLNSERLTSEIVDASIAKYRKSAFIWIPVIAFFLAFVTFLLNFGSFAAMQRWIDPRVEVNASSEADLAQTLKSINSRLKKLEQRSRSSAGDASAQDPEDE